MRRTRRDRPGWDDLAFTSYLGSLVITLVTGAVVVLALDLEGRAKAAALVALLLPCLALAAVIIYAIRNPLPRSTRRD